MYVKICASTYPWTYCMNWASYSTFHHSPSPLLWNSYHLHDSHCIPGRVQNMGRISPLWHISAYAFNTFVPFLFLHISIFMDFAAGEISLQQIPIWTEIDACAQSCALSASGYFSSSLQCPGTDPDSCLCTLGPTTQLAGLAHVCASKSCTSFLSYSADPERARAALTTYCEVNAAQRFDASISSNCKLWLLGL
jgi:hypothetical protein